MAGGVNPFGFSGGVIPQAVRPKRGPQDLPSAPFGFALPPSKWEQTKDILAPYVTAPYNAMTGLMSADLNTLLYDTGPKGREAVENSFNLAGNLAGASSVVPKPKNALNMGIRAFHGSPHDFPPVRLIEMPDGKRLYQNMDELADTPQGAKIIQEYPMGRFDMSKIGTGEGAQAYGHGLYFAEQEGIARSYRDALSNSDAPLAVWKRPDGSDVDPFDVPGAVTLLRNEDLDVPFATLMDRAQKELVRASSVRNPQLRAAQTKKAQEAFDWLKSNEGVGLSSHPERGHLYEVNIDADPNAFLDWDKPLSEQPEAVRKASAAALAERGLPLGPDGQPLMLQRDPRGELVNASLTAFGDAKNTPDLLSKHGIPGIKYLDAGSRAAGDGSRNYVVFDDKLVSIVKKYGIAGASAILGYNILDGLDPAQAAELKKIEGNK